VHGHAVREVCFMIAQVRPLRSEYSSAATTPLEDVVGHEHEGKAIAS
jgi:hypothetical protein